MRQDYQSRHRPDRRAERLGAAPARPGGVLFIDLRDRSGIVQIVFNPEFSGEAHAIADRVRNEYVLAVRGKVVERDPETVNPNLATGRNRSAGDGDRNAERGENTAVLHRRRHRDR